MKSTNAFSSGKINIKTALAEAKMTLITLGQASFITLAEKMPISTIGLSLNISAEPVVRLSVENVSTFIQSDITTVSSVSGLSF